MTTGVKEKSSTPITHEPEYARALRVDIDTAAWAADCAGRHIVLPPNVTYSFSEVMGGPEANPVLARRIPVGTVKQVVEVFVNDDATRTHVLIGADGETETTIRRLGEPEEAATHSTDPVLAHGIAAVAAMAIIGTAPADVEFN